MKPYMKLEPIYEIDPDSSSPSPDNVIRCESCQIDVGSGICELRRHCKSTWHTTNIKRTLAGQTPLTFRMHQEIEAAKLEQQRLTKRRDEEKKVHRCLVCNRNYKSDKSLTQHLKSKKHVRAMSQIRSVVATCVERGLEVADDHRSEDADIYDTDVVQTYWVVNVPEETTIEHSENNSYDISDDEPSSIPPRDPPSWGIDRTRNVGSHTLSLIRSGILQGANPASSGPSDLVLKDGSSRVHRANFSARQKRQHMLSAKPRAKPRWDRMIDGTSMPIQDIKLIERAKKKSVNIAERVKIKVPRLAGVNHCTMSQRLPVSKA